MCSNMLLSSMRHMTLWQAFRNVTVFVHSGGNTTERKREKAILYFIPLSIYNAHSGNSLSHSHNHRHPLPPPSLFLLSSLCFSCCLDPSYCTACFLPPFTRLLRASLCVCAQHVPLVWVRSTGFVHIQFRCLISTLCLIACVWLWVCACAPLYLLWI